MATVGRGEILCITIHMPQLSASSGFLAITVTLEAFAAIPLAINKDDFCEVISTNYCLVDGCCGNACTSQYQAYFQCVADTLGPCGAISCSTGGGGGGCFSATSTVQVLGQGSVEMQDLHVGDQVLTGSPGNFKYQRVYALGHLNKEALSTFYSISTKGSRMPLEMTGEHLVYLAGKHNPVRADSLVVGDILLSTHGQAVITSIGTVKKHGLFNPLTADGHLIVNDISVSTYIALQNNDQEYFQVVVDKKGDNKISLMSHQKFVHLYLAPFRMLCMGISSQLCGAVDADGIPLYISYGMKLVHHIGERNVFVQLVFLLVTFPIYLFFLAMEKLVGSAVAPLAIFTAAFLAMKGPKYLSLKKTKVV